MEIRFKKNCKGKLFAQVWDSCTSRFKNIGMEKAQLLIATGQATETKTNW
jgi:hypothetical protein